MELFIHGLVPGLVLILFAVALSFFIMPALAPGVLLTGSVVLFVVAAYFHWSQFGRDEYERATIWWNMKDYFYLVMIAVILVGCLIFYSMNQAASSGAFPGLVGGFFGESNLPPLSLPTAGGSLEDIVTTASSRIQNLIRKGRLTN
jgi:hypothetical protein